MFEANDLTLIKQTFHIIVKKKYKFIYIYRKRE